MAVGRITGPLLKANLLREGVNLAFETDLLYLDVQNGRIGIHTDQPQYDLDIRGTSSVNGLNVSSIANIANITITGNTISTSQPRLNLGTADTVVYQNKLQIDSIELENNVIRTNNYDSTADVNLELRPNGTGTVEIFADTNVYGNIVATGSITADGNITIGDADTDNVVFNAEIQSNIIPDQDNVWSLGSDPTAGGKQWADVWVNNFYAGTVTTTSLEVDGVDVALRQGNIWYVAENGDDTYSGDHPNDPYGSVKYAVENASAGDTVHIYPGTYTETFPITIPAGVTVKGHSLRSVNIKPSLATQSNDAFLLNGQVTVEDLTIKDFYYDNLNNTGYAFKFNSGFTVSTKSPYIRNVSVITQGSVTSGSDPRGFASGDAGKGGYFDASVADPSTNEASVLFQSTTFITPGVDAVTATNGTRIEWMSCFTYFANRAMYLFDSNSGIAGQGKTALRVTGVNGSYVAGETVTYYDFDNTTVLATGTIDSVDADGKFYISGKVSGFNTAVERGGKTITANGDAQLSITQQKFGESSLYLDGTGDYANISATNDFGFLTDDFTVETWIYLSNLTGTQQIFDFRAGSAADIAPSVYVTSSGQVRYYTDSADKITGGTLSTNTWHHIAVTRENGNTKLFVDGTQVGITYTDGNNYGVAKPLVLGADYNGLNELEGYIDDVRVVNTVAIYTANFTAPATRVIVTPETVLMARFDGNNGSTEFQDDVIYQQDIRFSGGATATEFTLVDYTDFGGELRSISSASIYGNYGAYGDGPGVLMYLISHNFAYVGAGKETTNDPINAIQTQEVTELNNAKVRYSSVDHKGDFRVGDLFHVDQQTGTVNFTSASFNIDTSTGLTITTGGSTTILSGQKIETGNLRISGNTIESLVGDIILDSASETVRVESTGAFNLPTGTTLQRPTSPEVGMIRYNTDTNLFEGYDGNWIALNGVYDLDLNTYITAELTPGANDNIIRFYADGSLVADINQTRFRADRIEVDDIVIDGNLISTITTNTDLDLSANGTGSVVIDELAFKNSSITNRTNNGITYIRNTGNGYFKIDSTGGFVVPVGLDIQRPPAANREIGMVRFNTNQNYLEIFDGTSWVSVAGSSGAITYSAAENLAVEYVLTLG